MKKTLIFILVISTLAACAEQPGLMTAPVSSPAQTAETLSQTDTTVPSITGEAVPESPPAVSAGSPTQELDEAPVEPLPAAPDAPQEIQIEVSDGLSISGTFHPASAEPPWPGVLLMHMLSGNRGQWDGLSPRPNSGGYAVLAIDLRGHGATGGEMDWGKARDDILQVLDYFNNLPYINPERVALVGASIGANLSLVSAANRPGIAAVALLSPGLDYRGVTTPDSLAAYGERPLFLAASEEDGYAADSTRSLAENASGEVELMVFDGAGHGTQMLEGEPGLAAAMINWLDRFLK